MSWNKGHDLLIDAVRQIRPVAPPLRCFFVGSGAEEDQIKARAYRHAEDRTVFTFLGFVKDLREVIWASDIFALPSRLEGFALAVVEAMSAGLVAIRTPSGGASDQIIDGESGIIVPFEDVDGLAEAITLLSDGATRAKMRARSLSHTRERFTRAGMTERVMTVYEDVSRLRTALH
jgi:glycosyltransferase involved in cell wall biosynthesis